jgi:hypothetical protein
VLFGTTVPFSASQLASLYPSHFQFVFRYALATLNDLFHGYLVPADAAELFRAAATSNVG